MKKLISTIIALTIAITAIPAIAKDKILTAPVERIYQKTDKNGETYYRFVIKEDRTLNGITYPASVLIMAFSDVADSVVNISAGDTIKAIVSESMYQGKKNYRLVHLLETN